MSTPVEPLRLLLLADEPEWATLLRECLQPLAGSAVLLTAPNWESVDSLFANDRQAVVLARPALQPAPVVVTCPPSCCSMKSLTRHPARSATGWCASS